MTAKRAVSPARKLAWRMVRAAWRQGESSGAEAVLAAERDRPDVDARELALAREIAYGACRMRRWLDKLLGRFLERPLPTKEAAVHDALVTALYQIAFLDRIPAHAVVDESVRLVREVSRNPAMPKLVNGILRRAAALPHDELLPDGDEPWPVRFGAPEWLVPHTKQIFSADAPDFWHASNAQAPLHLREMEPQPDFETRLRTELEASGQPDARVEKGLYPGSWRVLARGLNPEDLPCFRAGAVTAEDEGGQLAGWLAGADSAKRILDLCAAPGGKTAHLAALAGEDAELTATDVSGEKLALLRQTLRRLHLHDRVETGLAEDVDGTFDLVLVDAPCSGLGTLRRHPDYRWARTPESLARLARQQTELLDHASTLIKPGGILLYCVCTFPAAETTEVIEQFLEQHPAFHRTPAPPHLPFDPGRFADGSGHWRTAPHVHGADAFFIARLRQKD